MSCRVPGVLQNRGRLRRAASGGLVVAACGAICRGDQFRRREEGGEGGDGGVMQAAMQAAGTFHLASFS